MAIRRQSASGSFCGIVGGEELAGLLDQLPKAMGKAVLVKSLLKAAVPIKDEIMGTVPVGPTGNLRDSIEISTKLNPSQRKGHKRQVAEVFVGSTAPHAHLMEFGTVERTQKSTGRRTGMMKKKPFLRQAWDAKKERALEILKKEIWTELLKAVKRLRKQSEKGTLSKRNEEFLL